MKWLGDEKLFHNRRSFVLVTFPGLDITNFIQEDYIKTTRYVEEAKVDSIGGETELKT